MTSEFRAFIRWSPEQECLGLPNVQQSIDPAWFDLDEGGWSVAYRFDVPPSQQGNPSVAFVRFMMPTAPHERVLPGATLFLFERATHQYATLTVAELEDSP
jgi:hypothetical protein